MAVERCLSLLLFFSISLTFPLVEGVYSTKGNCLVPLQVPILDVGGKWMLRIEHLSKVYGEKKAVDEILFCAKQSWRIFRTIRIFMSL